MMVGMLTTCILILGSLGFGESDKKVGLMDRAAQISVSVMNSNSNTAFNTSYIFGVFGRNSLTGPAAGQLVHVHSEGGINHGCSDYMHDVPSRDWVALIERGTCYFHQKVDRATKQYNATAVIVYDDQPTTELVMMQSRVRDEVYVFVTQSYGRRLALLADSELHVQVNITDAAVSSSSPLLPLTTPCSILCSLLAAVYLLLCQTI